MTLILLSGGAEVAAAAGNGKMKTVLSRATHLRKISLMTTENMTDITFLIITAKSQDMLQC